ncbi:putative transposase [Staphylococcus aureus]|nr:putative transposase [Staphylococcus aureus]
MIITLRPLGRKATDIENALHSMFSSLPSHIFKSITFDCGKEFSNWKTICNCHDISIFFADPGTPSQRGLNEHSNEILRRSGLDKELNFNLVTDNHIIRVAQKINHRPRKSLGYRTPLEVTIKTSNRLKVCYLLGRWNSILTDKLETYVVTPILIDSRNGFKE